MGESTVKTEPTGPEADRGGPARVIWSPDYTAPAYAFDTTRKSKAVRDRVVERGLGPVAAPNEDVLADTEALIVAHHDPSYIEALRTGEPRHLAESQGFRWDDGIWTMALASTAGVVSALEVAIDHDFATGSLSSGLHHARSNRGVGFCTINGLAVAALALRSRIGDREKLAIFDVDAHCGGGTNELIDEWGLDHVMHLDVSTNGFDRYDPTGTDRQLHVAKNADDYMETVEQMLELIIASGYRAVLYNAGMDAIEMVPRLQLEQRESLVASALRNAAIPCAFVLAGGYTGSALDDSELADLHMATVEAFIA